MGMTGQAGAQRGVVGNPRYTGAGSPFVPGARLSSASSRTRSEGLLLEATDQVGLGGGITVSAAALTGAASAGLREIVPIVLDQAGALGRAAARLMPAFGPRAVNTGAARVNPSAVSSTGGAFADRVVAVSGGAGVSASAVSGARVGSYKFTVGQLAAGQTSTSNTFVSNGPNISPITNSQSLIVTVDSTSTTISPSFSTATNNVEALSAIATAVNSAGTGVRAQVVDTGVGSTVRLTRQSTGASATFSVSGNLANILGFTTTTSARDASFSIDGSAFTSATNTVQLDLATATASTGRVTAVLQAPTSTAVTVTIKVARDENSVVNAIQQFADRFNVFRQSIAASPSLLSAGLTKRLDAALDGLQNALQAIGVQALPDGTLIVNESRLRSMIQSDGNRVENTIGGVNGLASRVYGVTSLIQQSPTLLLSSGAIGASGYESAASQAGQVHLRGSKGVLDFQA